jgi:hypothetical protein
MVSGTSDPEFHDSRKKDREQTKAAKTKRIKIGEEEQPTP